VLWRSGDLVVRQLSCAHAQWPPWARHPGSGSALLELPPAVTMPGLESSFRSSSLWQEGQEGERSCVTNASNRSPQFRQEYSNNGMEPLG
jgi:hypothetical protein